jgi:hypothetical protein
LEISQHWFRYWELHELGLRYEMALKAVTGFLVKGFPASSSSHWEISGRGGDTSVMDTFYDYRYMADKLAHLCHVVYSKTDSRLVLRVESLSGIYKASS